MINISRIKFFITNILALLLCFNTVVFAETIIIDDKSFTKISHNALEVIKKRASFSRDCDYVGIFVDLDIDGKKTDMIITTDNACNWGMSSGPVIILSGTVKNKYEVMIDTRGYFVTLGTTLHGEYPSEKISITISGGGIHSGESFYVYSGNKYKGLSDDTEYIKDTHPIDVKMTKCLDTGFSTNQQKACLSSALDEWDKELNKSYTALMTYLNKEQKTAVRDSQRKWVNYRDSQIKAIEAIYEGSWSTAGLSRMIAIMELTKGKALELHEYAVRRDQETY